MFFASTEKKTNLFFFWLCVHYVYVLCSCKWCFSFISFNSFLFYNCWICSGINRIHTYRIDEFLVSPIPIHCWCARSLISLRVFPVISYAYTHTHANTDAQHRHTTNRALLYGVVFIWQQRQLPIFHSVGCLVAHTQWIKSGEIIWRIHCQFNMR